MTPESAIFNLTATLLSREISPELLAYLQSPEIAPSLIEVEPRCAELLKKPWTEVDYDEAAAEFCRLFVLNPVASPRAAAWLEDDKSGQSLKLAAQVQMWIDNGAITLDESFASLAPDHISILLLIFAQLQETSSDDAIAFHEQMLSIWLPSLIEALQNEARNPLYLLAARFLRETLPKGTA